MRGFILIAVMAVAVNARPEAPRSGYNYQAPAPIQSVSAGYSGAQSGGYNHNAQQVSGFGVSGGSNSGFGSGVSSGFNQGFSNGNGGQQQSFGQVSTSFNVPQQSFQQGSFQQQALPQTIVQKHIYVHVPPPEEEAEVIAQQQAFSAPRKHYKIIFIKAPSAPSITQQIAAAQAQSQEKTLIYVLVKKPEDIAALNAAAPAPALPVSKPEVYFIKYKTQKQQQQAVVDSSFGGFQGSVGGDVSSGSNSFSSGSGSSAGITDYVAPAPASQYGPPHKK